jgi:hypothetical protein
VLSLPLAFILSQDQTLRCNYKSFNVSGFDKTLRKLFRCFACPFLHSLNELFQLFRYPWFPRFSGCKDKYFVFFPANFFEVFFRLFFIDLLDLLYMALCPPGPTGLPASSLSVSLPKSYCPRRFSSHLFVELASFFLKAAAKKCPFFESAKSFFIFFQTPHGLLPLPLVFPCTPALSSKAAAKKCPFSESSKSFFIFFWILLFSPSLCTPAPLWVPP